MKDDPRLLQELCSEFEQYTVETFLWIPFDSMEYFEHYYEHTLGTPKSSPPIELSGFLENVVPYGRATVPYNENFKNNS